MNLCPEIARRIRGNLAISIRRNLATSLQRMINSLLIMDNIKLYAINNDHLDFLITAVRICPQDII